jgi:hypothetical protein
VERIEIFSRWVGFADPPSHAAKLTLTPSGDRFHREQALAGTADELPAELVTALLAALSRDAVPALDPALFGVPEAVIRSHYSSLWTDDSPSHLVRIKVAGSRILTIRTEAQQAFMLPLRVTDPATGTELETFDPRLSQAIAALMPDAYLEKDRLAGRLGMLQQDVEEATPQEEQPDAGPEPPPAEPFAAPTTPDTEESKSFEAELIRILFGEESPAERREAEQAGRLSERLLRRNAPAEVRDLLARGADPSVADENGQTALMLAASPPLDRERFRLLVQAGADVEARRYDGCTGLHLACAGGMDDAAEEWARAGADIHARTPEGATPLMLAATWPEIVRLLLAAGADVNAADQDGHTPLVYAILKQSSVVAEGQLGAIRALIAAGADANRPDRQGVTPLEHARRALARVQLEEEVARAFDPEAELSFGLEWDDRRLAEAIMGLLAAAAPK